MRLAALLRLTAFGIALLCWLDPPSIVAPPPAVVVDAAIVRSPRAGRPVQSGDSTTVLERARQLAARLSEQLADAGTVRLHEIAPGAPLPCDAAQPCVVLTDGASVAIPADRKGPLGLVAVGRTLMVNVEVTGVSVEPAHAAGQATAQVTLAGRGVQGRLSRLRLYDESIVVGEGTHQWASDGEVTLDVPWWPVAAGARRLTARAVTEEVEEETLVDNDLDAPVEVTAERWRVAVVERRPSWAATFIRRALEGDRRFDVAARTDMAPRVRATPRVDALQDEQLDQVRVVVAGAPDALTDDDVSRLDRFVRLRGGAVILAPDRPMSGPVTRLIQHRWRERLENEPSPAGPLRASEWLVAADINSLDRVWAESDDGAAVVASPAGAGVILVSGALDAWRHRGTDGAYERFWQGTVAGLAMAVGTPVDVDLAMPASGAFGGREATVHARTVSPTDTWHARATRACDGDREVAVRLWPGDAPGSFTARVPIGTRTGCRVLVSVAGVGEATAVVADESEGASPRWTPADMDAIAARSGGLVVRDDNVAPLADMWIEARSTDRRPERRYPMRSWWWVVPFVASLAGEWWLRRRAGRR